MQNFNFLCVFDMYAYVLTSVCTHTHMWRPEVGVWCFPQSLSLPPHLFTYSFIYLLRCGFTEPGAYLFSRLTGQRSPPSIPVHRFAVHAYHQDHVYTGAGYVPSTLSYLPAHLLFLEALKFWRLFSSGFV